MNVQRLIHAIVRQTTVLIAQVATTSGVRSPLAKLANQVFLDLVTELERQGLSRKVVADMFGLALRSYQQKVERLTESASDSGRTLWQAVYEHLQSVEVASRGELLHRFRRDDESIVKSILRDLVETGLVYQRGKGDQCTYRVAPDADLERDGAAGDSSLEALVWLTIYREGPLSAQQLADELRVDVQQLQAPLEVLCSQGRIASEHAEPDNAPRYSTRRCLIPLGDEAGWEAAMIDHYQAVVVAICSKLRNGVTRALPPDRVGGSTYSFDVWPGHPHEEQAYALLAETRKTLSEFWDRVSAHNQAMARPEQGVAKVTFYFGQSISQDDSPGVERCPLPATQSAPTA